MSRIFNLTRRNIQLLSEMNKNDGSITESEQTTYSAFAFYMNIKVLKRLNFVTDDGMIFNNSNKKSWSLTEKGKKLLHHINEIDKLWQ